MIERDQAIVPKSPSFIGNVAHNNFSGDYSKCHWCHICPFAMALHVVFRMFLSLAALSTHQIVVAVGGVRSQTMTKLSPTGDFERTLIDAMNASVPTPKTYIHIGPHKTGSSSVQEFMTNQGKLLSKHNIKVPYSPGCKQKSSKMFAPLPRDLQPNLKRHHKNSCGSGANAVENLIDGLQSVDSDVFLSAELFDHLDSAGIQKLKDTFDSVGHYDFHIIMNFRPVISHAISVFLEHAKSGNEDYSKTDPFQRVMSQVDSQESGFMLRTDNLITKWAEAFG